MNIKRTYNKVIGQPRSLAHRAFLNGQFGAHNSYILASSPRSGSTWLGQILSSIPGTYTVFEPLQPNKVRGVKRLGGFEEQLGGFDWSSAFPGDKWQEGQWFWQRVLSGEILNWWTTKESTLKEARSARHLLVKTVRATRTLPWICSNFDVPPPIFLMRHPCAVVASQLKTNWEIGAERPVEPEYFKNYPKFQEALRRTSTREEFLAAKWALDQLPALLQAQPLPWVTVTYEELNAYPERTISRIFNDIGIRQDDLQRSLALVDRPSSTVGKQGVSGLSGWHNTLSEQQVTMVLRTVHSFGLNFYSELDEPDYDCLYGRLLRQQIVKSGRSS